MILQKTTILHVDDDAGVCGVVSALLSDEGYRVVSASNAQEGLSKLKTIKAALVILDMNMPGMSGVTFLQQMAAREDIRAVPVLVVTAYTQMVPEDARGSVAGLLAKPFTGPALVTEVARILSGEVSASEPPAA